MRIIIAGAGIAGLATGLALAARGIASTIVEQVASPGEVGAGLQLGPNAVHALQRIGAADAVRPRAVAPEAVVLRDGASGRILGEVALGRVAVERYGAPYWTVHRGDLHGALMSEARSKPDIAIVTGRQAVGYEDTERDITVRFGDGSEMTADALIGADGVWSRIRTQMFPDVAPKPSGYVAYRALLPPEIAGPLSTARQVGAWLTPDAHLIHYPVSAGKEINVVLIAKSAWSERSWSVAAERDDVVRALRSFPTLPWSLADAVPWLKWSLGAPVKLPALARGRVALNGDAGHATLPFLAQGAAMAIEGAVVLADKLADTSGDVADALDAYDHARRARVRRVQERSSRNAQIFHLSGPARAMRDLVLGAMPPAALIRQWDWLYGVKV